MVGLVGVADGHSGVSRKGPHTTIPVSWDLNMDLMHPYRHMLLFTLSYCILYMNFNSKITSVS